MTSPMVRWFAAALAVGAGVLASAAETAPEFRNPRFDDSPATKAEDLYYTKLNLSEVSDLAIGGQSRVRGEFW